MKDFIFLVVVTKKVRVQDWDTGFGDSPIYSTKTEKYICYNQKQVDEVYKKNKYCESITKYDCFKRY